MDYATETIARLCWVVEQRHRLFTLREVAAHYGFSLRTWHEWRAGRMCPSARSARQIAARCGLRLDRVWAARERTRAYLAGRDVS
jgi:hypothetical protein